MSNADNTVMLDGSGIFLRQFLSPIQAWLDRDDVSEVCINEPGVVWVEKMGGMGMERHVVGAID